MGLVEKEAAKHDIAAINQFAHQRQQQEQNAINAQRALQEEVQAEPMKRLAQESHLMSAHASPESFQLGHKATPAPTPPNPYNVGAGLLGQLAQMQMQQQQGFKKGGHVKRKYADGGYVQHFMDMQKHIQPDPYDNEMKSIAHEMRNYRVNPMQNWLSHVSAQMLANNRDDPLANMGQGAMLAQESMGHHHQRMLDARAKAANLYNSMNESRRHQHQLLADYESKQQEMAEQARHHRASEAIQMASHNDPLDRAYKMAQLEQLRSKGAPQEIVVGDRVIRPVMKVGMTPQDRIALNKVMEEKKELQQLNQPYIDMMKFIKEKEKENELPATGLVASMTPDWLAGENLRDFRRKQTSMIKSGILPGQRGKVFLEFAGKEKPTGVSTIGENYEFADYKSNIINKEIEKRDVIEELAAYEIPTRVSQLAYERWDANGKKGDLIDYVADILEGRASLHEHAKKNKSENESQDMSSMSDQDLERIASQ